MCWSVLVHKKTGTTNVGVSNILSIVGRKVDDRKEKKRRSFWSKDVQQFEYHSVCMLHACYTAPCFL